MKHLAWLLRLGSLLALVVPTSARAVPSCDWLVYDAARGTPQVFFTDADATPPFAMRLDAGFHVPAAAGVPLAQRGGLDFDGDGKTDPFRLTNRDDGLFQWQFLTGKAPTAWQSGAYDATDFEEIQFGDFDGDGKTDGFSAILTNPHNAQFPDTLQFRYSSGAVSNYVNLGSVQNPRVLVAPARFDADAKTDLFATAPDDPNALGSPLDWFFFSNADVLPTALAQKQNEDIPSLRLGDFDGDGLTDVFTAFTTAQGDVQWLYVPHGTAPSVLLAAAPFPLREVRLGEFDGDGKTDIFATRALPDGRVEWVYWSGGTGDPIALNTVDGPAPLLGDFVGDARTDALVIRCGDKPALTTLPSIDVAKTPGAFFAHVLADTNGDGRRDIVRVSTCQNFVPGQPFCGANANLVQTLLGDGQGGFSVGALQALSPQVFQPSVLFGDVNGDGLTDVVRLDESVSTRVLVSTATGDGAFADHPAQTFILPSNVNAASALIDVNHDGRGDLLWTTVCLRGTGFASPGCVEGDDNRVVTALANADGTFSLGAIQTLGTSGWQNFFAYTGDVNGDGLPDVVFESRDATLNRISVALGDGAGGFTLQPEQTDDTPRWDLFDTFVADVDGDGRQDLVWVETCNQRFCDGGASLIVRVGLAKADGTFDIQFPQDIGFGYWREFDVQSGDLNGDGRVDLLLTSIGAHGSDAGVVYELISDGDGGFTASPMQVLRGRGWFPGVFDDVQVGDVTGDHHDELVFMESIPALDHDRVIVVGDGAAAGGGGPGGGPPPSGGQSCGTLSGAAAAACRCAAGLPLSACPGATLPAKLTGSFAKACMLLGKTSGASAKVQRKLDKQAIKRLTAALRAAGGKKVIRQLGASCDGAIRDELTALRTDTRAAKNAVSGR